ncbi:acyl-CoA dehydrogenase family protein [Enteractinococcus fodinae]|uniref:Alkylation response protein AidB-like acyl-CoA dehydrogenase n=1 Tax=Enteractinococcus fodinae TaxID=684663 RepID=A0ABU2B6G0_9MICC|nr:acyl-CoA dehydrogenase family protein [Enteractinococcus fodinae]MDR7347964.1 alkylation response protein AidB-like acyl-CoA dehydrogenase [Enteractinococcus fodinae]
MTTDTSVSRAGTNGSVDTSPVPDSWGINRFTDDGALQQLLPLYLSQDLYDHLLPQFERLGARLGGELDDLAHQADQNPPVLHHRTRSGQDIQRIEKHPAYQQLEQVAFGELGMAAMSHRGGVLGWPEPLPPVVKYLTFYLFAQAEFGLECPVSMTDALTRTLRKYGDPALVAKFIDGLTSQNLEELTQGAMFMTEQDAGSDVGRTTTTARDNQDGTWSLTGEKWFCSNADADLALVLARPEGAEPGIKGIGLFIMPRRLDDGQLNSYRIVRLKDKLGTRSMASGEISLQGATAYLVGDLGQGFKQMADMINSSRLSNGVRAAGMMRRAFGEARYVALNREAFGRQLVDLPLQRRQLIKMLVPTEQATSIFLHTARVFAEADAGDSHAASVLRILTPLVKLRACRDARKVAGDAMEARGGVGYIEEYGDARILRDVHLGSIWEGTTNIIGLDVVRAAHRAEALTPLIEHLRQLLDDAASAGAEDVVSGPLRNCLEAQLDRVTHAVEGLADSAAEEQVRQVATALYNITSAVIMVSEGARIAAASGDHSRLVLAAMVLRHRVLPQDPLAPVTESAQLLDALIRQQPVTETQAADYAASLAEFQRVQA